MSLNDWVLALHVLSAFALAGAMVVFWVVYVALRSGGVEVGGLVRVGTVATGIGMTGTLVFGLWLAIALDAYHPWDGWVIAAIVLWAVAGGLGDRAGRASREPDGLSRAFTLHAITTALVVLLLVDMIWKPGA